MSEVGKTTISEHHLCAAYSVNTGVVLIRQSEVRDAHADLPIIKQLLTF